MTQEKVALVLMGTEVFAGSVAIKGAAWRGAEGRRGIAIRHNLSDLHHM
jgi:hypothetical protein